MKDRSGSRSRRRRELRAYVAERSLRACEWPTCGDSGTDLAHIVGTGMGGRASSDRRSNVAWLCREHHDVLDGRRRILPADFTALGIVRIPVDAVSDREKLASLLRRAMLDVVRRIRLRNGEDLEDDEP